MSNDITELQSRLAFQEDAINQLTLTVSRQQNEIENLKRALQTQGQRIQALSSPDQSDPSQEIPPHY